MRSGYPVMMGGTVLVPLRDLFTAFGTQVEYEKGNITLRTEDHVVQITVYSHKSIVDGTSKSMNEAPTYVGGKTYVPLRFLSEAFGAEVSWDQSAIAAKISYQTTVKNFEPGIFIEFPPGADAEEQAVIALVKRRWKPWSTRIWMRFMLLLNHLIITIWIF